MIQQYNDRILCSGNLDRPLSPERACSFHRMIDGLSAEGKEVVRLVFNTPAEMIGMIKVGRYREFNLLVIKDYLRGKGWSILRIRKTIKEIKTGLREIE